MCKALGWVGVGVKPITAREIKKIFGTGAKKPCCATGFESNKKNRRFLGGPVIWAKTHLSSKLQDQMRTQGPCSKFGLWPSGLNISCFLFDSSTL